MKNLNNILQNFIRSKKRFVSFKYFSLLCFFSMSPIFADLTWQFPAQEVSASNFDHDSPQITTDTSGANVYIVWRLSTGLSRVQTISSNDFGNNWSSPLTLNTTGGGLTAQSPQIAIDNTGKYVYVVYTFDPTGASIFSILFTRSTDFGQTWVAPASQTTLSPTTSILPFVTTNNNGQYVYAIWGNGTTDDVQFSRSVDFGANWLAPANVIDLSDTTQISNFQIVTDDSGRYVHTMWIGLKAPDTIRQVQASSSSDFGVSWTPVADIPKLSANDANASFLNLATDSSGKYAYAVWQKSVGGSTVVQFSRSIDFGANWTTFGINLSSTTVGVSSTRPKVVTDKSGRYVFVIWDHSGGGADHSIRIRRSTDFGVTWENPVIIPSDSPSDPDIAIDNVGRYVYVIWSARDGAAFIQESSLSFNFGQTYTTPIRVSSQTEDSFGDPVITTNDSGIYGYSSFSEQNAGFFQIMKALRGIDIPRTNKRFELVRP